MSDAQNQENQENTSVDQTAAESNPAATPATDTTTTSPADTAAEQGADGQAQTTQQSTDAGASGAVVADTPTAAVQTAGKSTSSSAIANLEELAQSSSASVRAAVSELLVYIDTMAPKKPTPMPQQLQQQAALFHLLTRIPNTLGDDFQIVWKAVLAVFHELKDGVFHEAYVFRHFDNVSLSETQRKGFLGLLNLIKLTADPKGRQQALKQIDMSKALQFGLSEEGRNRIENFYGL